MIVSNYFIKKKIRGLAADPPARDCLFRSLRDVKNILVFYEARQKETIEPCLEDLRMLHKKMTVCVYTSGTSSRSFPDGYQIIGPKDVNIWGFPSPAISHAVQELKADLLIDLSGPHCYPLQYLLLQHPSPFKVGIKRGSPDLYDLSILVTEQDDIKYLFGQILFYLQSIHSK